MTFPFRSRSLVPLVLGLVGSAGLFVERLTGGKAGAAIMVSLVWTGVALTLARRASAHIRAKDLAAIGAGIALAHLVFRAGAGAAYPWLVERPSQLVNDLVVGVGAWLAIVGLGKLEAKPRVVLAGIALAAIYLVTASRWHLDVPPRGPTLAVQTLVPLHLAAIALALATYRAISPRREAPWR